MSKTLDHVDPGPREAIETRKAAIENVHVLVYIQRVGLLSEVVIPHQPLQTFLFVLKLAAPSAPGDSDGRYLPTRALHSAWKDVDRICSCRSLVPSSCAFSYPPHD